LANHIFGIVVGALFAFKAMYTSFTLLKLFVVGAFLLEESFQG